MEAAVEVGYLLLPSKASLGYLVEFLFYAGSEVEIEYVREIPGQELVDHHPHVGRHELSLLAAGVLRQSSPGNLPVLQRKHPVEPWLALLFAAYHIVAALDGGNRGRVCGRTAYSEVFHLLHERGLRESRRREREPLHSGDFLSLKPLPRSKRRKHGLSGLPVFGTVDTQESVELHHLALCAEPLRPRRYLNVGLGLLYLRVGHLRGHGAPPYQFIETPLAVVAVYGAVGYVGRAYGLVGLLRPLGTRMVMARLEVFLAHPGSYGLRYVFHREFGKIERIGTHISDLSVLVELLRRHHSLVDREPEPPVCVLLEGRCGVGRLRRTL